MPNDLWYFHESDLNKSNYKAFFNCLPEHLRRMFKDSFGEFSSDATSDHVVLQGYRGPHNNGGSGDSAYVGPRNGLQEVSYWWGESKLFLIALPIWLAIRALQDTAWHSLYFDSKTGECLGHNKNEAARKLSNKGHQLFQEGKYAEAEEYHNNAYQACSSGYEYEQAFKNDRDRAKEEKDAVNLNSQGESLFSEGKYTKALSKYQEAYDNSNISKEYNKYSANKKKAQAEIDAMNFNSEGDQLFTQGKYTEAFSKYQEAYNKSQISKEHTRYSANKEKAQVEIDAIHFNSEGDHLFTEGNYSEALSKYQEAYNKSHISKEYTRYSANKEKAQAEIDAIHFNSEGDHLFTQGKYTEALIKYQDAYDRSFVERDKNKYALSINNARALKNKLSILDNLWNQAWDAENDTASDRSDEAKDFFQRVLSETKDSLKIFPYNFRFKQYEILASIKIDGNELFNEGLEAQQDGSILLQEAQELKLQQKFESALVKYKEAKSKFSEAQEKFKTGREKDRQFVSCIDFVHYKLNEVLQSIEVTEQHALSSRLFNLDISASKSDSLEVDSCKWDTTGDDNYYNQI